MDQESLFHERVEDAIGAVADRLGRKRVACKLWPDKSERDAHNLFDACLNPERRERLTPSQMVFVARLGRDGGYHGVMVFLARDLGYSEPVALNPEDESAKLKREFIEASGRLAQMVRQIERLNGLGASKAAE